MPDQTPPAPHKRRKLDSPAPAQSAVSAISALAARRRLAASATGDSSPTSNVEGSKSAPSSPNPFSALQSLHQTRPQTSSTKRPGSRPVLPDAAPASQNGPRDGDRPLETGVSRSNTRVITFSSFSLTKNNHRIGDNGLITLELDKNERFLLVGSYGIRVLSGQVNVAGASLRPSIKISWVHAPHCHAVPVLRTTEPSSLEIHHDARAAGLRKLGRLSPLFRKLWNETAQTTNEELPSTFQFLGNSGDAPKGTVIQELSSPPKWNEKMASLSEFLSEKKSLSVVVCGPKSAGKSTFSRLLTNRLLTTAGSKIDGNPQALSQGAVVLDLDPGQPEYAPPGTISLIHVTSPNLGVPFSHPSLDDEPYKVLRCHSLASVNLASAADLHLECALDLFDYYQRKLRNCPLIINTPGWVLSLGLELLVDIITKIRPSHVVYMSEEGPAETVETLQGATKNHFALLPSQPSELKARTAAQLREMQTMSYFHSSRPDGHGDASKLTWVPRALSCMHPILVRYTGDDRGFLGILRYDFQLEPDLIAEGINGMVLAIVRIQDRRAFRDLIPEHAGEPADGAETELEALVDRTPEGIPFIPNPDDLTLDPRYSHTVGLALVRGVDRDNKCLHIMTPMPPQRLEEPESRGCKIVLVHGNFDTPTWSYTEHLYEQAGQEGEQGEEEDVSDDDEDNDSGGDDGQSQEVRPTEPARGADGKDATVPWVEVLQGNKSRPTGSQVWRVRRDLGRTG